MEPREERPCGTELCARELTFVADGPLGELAGLLSTLGYDVLWESSYNADDILRITGEEPCRIVLTQNPGLIGAGSRERCYLVRAEGAHEQLIEVVRRFDLPNRDTG